MNDQQQNLNSDLDSIYSFDSVATNERLLDRLDFDNASVSDRSIDSYNIDQKRKSQISLNPRHNSVGYYNNYLNQVDNSNLNSIVKLRNQNQRSNSFKNINNQYINNNSYNNNINNYKQSNDHTKTNSLSRNDLEDARLRSVSKNFISTTVNPKLDRITHEVASLKYDSIDDLPTSSSSNNHLKNNNTKTTGSDKSLEDLTKNASKLSLYPPGQSRSPHLFITQHRTTSGSSITSDSSNNSFNSSNHNQQSTSTTRPQQLRMFTSREEIPTISKNSSGNDNNDTEISEIRLQESPNIKHSSLTNLQTSRTLDLSPEERTNIALELRKQGNQREASYQLQIAANEPFNYPKAMYHYAVSLKYGYGVKQNFSSSSKWICKCILISSVNIKNDESDQHTISVLVNKLNKLSHSEIMNLILSTLENTKNSDIYNNGSNPEEMYLIFKQYDKLKINHVISINKNKSDVVALSYYELGNFFLGGLISNSKDDEINGIICLSKSASLGYIHAMEQLGEIWTNKTKAHKKDLAKAAAWLRSSEIFGVKSIGNSWIYKDKYLNGS
ncbi:hypothetical protein KGF54_004326 [Candida jiufengensis]|uniref:uncharacterized protein n=1 Tax=Candida jiufengensis TaxID=497108 RepID=UPI0022257F98|nr:uncharacterized protein KGF54_004326 [Candida jiufengensis]KAI5951252.1 hypothetical protein KGF54_004326 [Candida jiufengensis]